MEHIFDGYSNSNAVDFANQVMTGMEPTATFLLGILLAFFILATLVTFLSGLLKKKKIMNNDEEEKTPDYELDYETDDDFGVTGDDALPDIDW